MSSRTSTLARTLTHTTLRRTALPLSLGLTSGLVAIHSQQPLRFDTATAQSRTLASGPSPKRKDFLDAETVKQFSSGSLAGWCCPEYYLLSLIGRLVA